MPGVELKAIRPVKFRTASAGAIDLEARQGIREYLNAVKEILQNNYNTARPSPRYKRREMAGIKGGWRVHVRSNNFGELVNNVRGVQYVQGRYRTPRHRSAKWRTVNQVARETAPLFEQIMNRRLLPRRFVSESVESE